ncbi:MAG TPA: hypothetical protein VGJ07_09545 [Rugosimonospora sp.]
MNDSIRLTRRAWSRTARTATAIIATAALALLTAACSGSPSSTGSGSSPHVGGSSSSPSAVAYSACMRSHGVPTFPDPDSSGALPKTAGNPQQLGVSTSQYQAAQQACQHLLPTGLSFLQQAQQCESNGDCPQALVQQILAAGRQYAQCMRSHGVAKFPDPTTDSEGRVFFNISQAGISHQYRRSSQFESNDSDCERLVGGVPMPFG